MTNRNKWFWGIFLILAAIVILIMQFTSFATIGVWSIIATLILAAIIIQGIMKRSFSMILLPLPFLYMIYHAPLGLPQINGWLLFFSALLLGIGLEMLFGRHKHSFHFREHGSSGDFVSHSTASDDCNNPVVHVSFTQASKFYRSTALRNAQFDLSFGELLIYLEQAVVAPEGATIQLACSFGELRLYIPKQYAVVTDVRQAFGNVSHYDDAPQTLVDSSLPTIRIQGEVNFGEIQIHHM